MSSLGSPKTAFDKSALSGEHPLPLYMQLARHLRGLITSGSLGERDALPGERELAEMFEVSRVTVRKALRELSAEGLLSQRQGAGTFVNRNPHVEQSLSALTSFTEDIAARGMSAGSRWISRATGPASPEEALALGLSPGAQVAKLRRLRLADGIPLAIEFAVLPARFLPEPEALDGSLYQALRARGYPPFRALQRLSAVCLTPEQSRLLEVADAAPALHIERRSFLEDGTPLELVRSQYRGDAYDYIVELNLV
ncbi:GntR family transcriptional regulator [Azospirillum sp. SYSU D00513]|uniref:GntR family transcriptional regulator n=1 Tax=Azospirillum sp. SYSU D00513 TaxID=2812561 RepID=UPI001A960518|nr:GntR family transcriptional regulator [Azospirillum sp. SYSU D00513]